MKLLKSIWLITAISISLLGQAQESLNNTLKKNQFQFGFGIQYGKTLDLQFSPNLYQFTRPGVELGYCRVSQTGIFTTALNLAGGTLKPNSGGFKTVYTRNTDFYGEETIEDTELINPQMLLDFHLGYLRKVRGYSNGHRILYFGGKIHEHLTFAPGLINLGTINYLSLSPAISSEWMLPNGKSLAGEFEMSMLSVVTRLPYHNAPAIPGKSDFATFFTGHNSIESLMHLQNINLSVSYPVLTGKKMALYAAYKFNWMHYSLPEHLTETASQIQLNFNF